jgi:general secretion pathway protein E/type IV pilus assembly protein PilB
MTMTSVHALREAQPNVTLVERLIAAGLISEGQLRRAMQEKKRSDRPLGEILVELGMISEKVLDETLAHLLGDDVIDLHALLPDAQALAMVLRETAERYSVLPIEFDRRTGLLTLAVTEALDLAGVDEISRGIDPDIEIATVTANEASIRAAINRFYDVALTIPDILREIDSDASDILQRDFDTVNHDHPLDRLIDAIVVEAVRRDATAIHFEPEHGFVRVRFRLNGVLSQVLALHQSYWPGMAARLAAISGLSQGPGASCSEASAEIALGTRRKVLHVSRRATLLGDDFVIGIIAADREVMLLDELGLDKEALQRLRLLMARPHGMVVVAGPPGSGKTSTLYSMLNYRQDESVSIMTLEERVRCPLPSIRQTASAGWHERGEEDRLESLMHQDFDVLVMDELRDARDTGIAIQAANRGHQVYATVQAMSVHHTLSRLDELGLHRTQMAENVVALVGQRLLRQLCEHCKQAYAPQPFEREIIGASDSEILRLYREGACEHCDYLGYAGRIAIFEVLEVDKAIVELLSCGGTAREMRSAMLATGFSDLADAAVRQVLVGVTSLAEASRVVDLSARIN